MQAAFIEAVVNRDHRVLGRKLHDFCILDAIALSVAGNPIWIGGKVGMEHLQQAVLICALDHGRFLRARLGPQNRWEWFARILWKRQNRLRERDGLLPWHLALWDAYVADFYASPEFFEPDEEGERLCAPELFSMACFIEDHSNMTTQEIMTAPIGLMMWKSATLAERLGIAGAKMMSEEQIAMGREQEAAFEAERKAAEQQPSVGDSPTEPEGHA